MKTKNLFLSLAVVLSALGSSVKGQSVTLSGAGSTFVMPFYNMAFNKFTPETGIKVTYGGIGSGGGIRSLKDKVVDFGASDAYLDDKQMDEMPAKVVQFPTCSGAVVMAFNLPGISEIKLTPAVLAGIYLGQITNWNSPMFKKFNPGVKFPDKAITVVYRSDGSGTTNIFTNYLSKISPMWKEKVGFSTSVKWPAGIGAKGNPGVAGTISQTIGAIGYVGSEYAFAEKISYALMLNKSGYFIKPTIASIAAAGKGTMPTDTRVMITNSSDREAYPIAGFTWVLLYKEQNYNKRSLKQAEDLLKLWDWMVSKDAQAIAVKVNYTPLPASVVALDKKILRTITYNGKPILK